MKKINKRVFSLILFFVTLAISVYLYLGYKKGEIRIFSYIIQTKFTSIKKDEIKTFVINLDRTPERYEKVKKQLDQNNIEHERFSAIDGYNLEITRGSNGHSFSGQDLKVRKERLLPNESYKIATPSGDVNYVFDIDIIDRALTAGEFGCTYSHREIWGKMVKENIKYALIFEDDVTLLPGFQDRLNSMINKMPQEWDILYFYLITPKKGNKVLNILNNDIQKIIPNRQSVFSAAGYLVNIDSARKLFELTSKLNLSADHQISFYINQNQIKAYKTKEYYITAPNAKNPEDSLLFEMGREQF